MRQGGLVAFPTETVYGLGADAFNERALAKIFEVKGRPKLDPLILHVSCFADLAKVSEIDLRDKRLQLLKALWPGPLTLILPKKSTVPAIATSGLPSVAVRIPANPVASALLESFGGPIAAPSANPFSYVSPTTAQHVEAQLGEKIEMILDGGECQIGLESTILSILEPTPKLLRPGGVPLERLEEILGKIEIAGKDSCVLAPGMLPEHYSPRTKLEFLRDINLASLDPKRTGLVLFSRKAELEKLGFASLAILSENGDLGEISHGLFSAMRDLDRLRLDLIVVDSCATAGLGRAIMDRLERAAKRLAPPTK